MSHKPSKFWTLFALPASLLILASAYYLRVSAVREAIDARTPVVRKLLGRFLPGPPTVVVETRTKPAANPATPAPQPSPATAGNAGVGGPATGATAPGIPPVFDLQKLARDRTLWPKKVTLKKPSKFPAVVNGKVVGELVAPVGTEANLKVIKDGQLGLEFEGGGAWVAVEDTDIATRVPGQ